MKDELIQISGKAYKQCEVVMLPTNDQTQIAKAHKSNYLIYADNPMSDTQNNRAGYTNQHLYILSSEEIKEGEDLRATDEIKQKISNSLKGKPTSESKKENCRKAQTGLKRSKESIEKTRQKLKHPISQYDLQGNFIKNWNSIREAANKLGFLESQIGRCVNGKRKTAYKFIWKRQ